MLCVVQNFHASQSRIYSHIVSCLAWAKHSSLLYFLHNDLRPSSSRTTSLRSVIIVILNRRGTENLAMKLFPLISITGSLFDRTSLSSFYGDGVERGVSPLCPLYKYTSTKCEHLRKPRPFLIHIVCKSYYRPTLFSVVDEDAGPP